MSIVRKLILSRNRLPIDSHSYAEHGTLDRKTSIVCEFHSGIRTQSPGRVINLALPHLLLSIVNEIPHNFHLVARSVAQALVRIFGILIDIAVLVIHIPGPVVLEV